MKEYIKRAQKNYVDKKKNEGWCYMSTFVPKKIKDKLLEIKNQMMKGWYEEN